MKILVRFFLIIFLTVPFISTQTAIADDKKEELKNTIEDLPSCDMSDETVPPYLLESERNYTNTRERRDSAPPSFSWEAYMPPHRVHFGGAT